MVQDTAIDNFDLSKSNTNLKIYTEIGLQSCNWEKNCFDMNSFNILQQTTWIW